MSRLFVIRFTAPILLVSGLLLLIGGFAAWYVHRLQATTSAILDQNLALTQATEEFQSSVGDLRSQLRQFLIDGDVAHFDTVDHLLTDSEVWLKEMQQLNAATREREPLGPIVEAYLRFRAELARRRAGLPASRDEAREALSPLIKDQLTQQLLLPTHEFLKRQEQITADRSHRNRSLTDRVALVMLLLGSCGAVAGLLTGFSFARGISRSMVNLTVPIRDAAGRLSEVVGPITLKAGAGFEEMETVLHRLAGEVGGVVDQLQQSQHEVLRGEQLAAVGQLAAGLAHELRNPLTSIKVLVQTANDQGGPEHLTRQDLIVIEEEVTRLEKLIQHFLDFARPPETVRQPVNLAAVLEQTVRLVAARAEQQQAMLRIDLGADPVTVTADAGQVRQVFLNLLLNALDALEGGGEVTVRLWRPTPASVTVEVADSGPGLPPGMEERIFEPFFSTKETGTGLGLAICRRLVTAHGGTIRAATRQGGGAAFIVTLPAGPPADGEPETLEGANGHAARVGGR